MERDATTTADVVESEAGPSQILQQGESAASVGRNNLGQQNTLVNIVM